MTELISATDARKLSPQVDRESVVTQLDNFVRSESVKGCISGFILFRSEAEADYAKQVADDAGYYARRDGNWLILTW